MVEQFNKKRYPLLGNGTVKMLLRHHTSRLSLGNVQTHSNRGAVGGGIFYVVQPKAI
jgi:hypothetical protein